MKTNKMLNLLESKISKKLIQDMLRKRREPLRNEEALEIILDLLLETQLLSRGELVKLFKSEVKQHLF